MKSTNKSLIKAGLSALALTTAAPAFAGPATGGDGDRQARSTLGPMCESQGGTLIQNSNTFDPEKCILQDGSTLYPDPVSIAWTRVAPPKLNQIPIRPVGPSSQIGGVQGQQHCTKNLVNNQRSCTGSNRIGARRQQP